MVIGSPVGFSGAVYVTRMTEYDRGFFVDALKGYLDFFAQSVFTFLDSFFGIPGLLVILTSTVVVVVVVFVLLRRPYNG